MDKIMLVLEIYREGQEIYSKGYEVEASNTATIGELISALTPCVGDIPIYANPDEGHTYGGIRIRWIGEGNESTEELA